ncbi:cobalt-factor II C(20)-methyltransferase [Stygiolobus azoricus]|uniref:Cobalt-factor II C(20)-methyltransferase n=1 Tax=Stygiolobus azoricus TaxID=41675 RepID=A0A650CNS5_9CREN|nr:cobalt-factor II C(20)-methyltransferase [Stygiolobus azoricus]QGR19147.1 cobalt-factor II C(20)-methyltransferase [Stygiolobus azoricus]
MTKELFVIGLGPGDPELVTIKASKILSLSKVVFVPYSTTTNRSLALSVISPYISQTAKVVPLGFPMGKEVDEGSLRKIGEDICNNVEDGVNSFVTLGDPSLYSTYYRVSKFINCIDRIDLIPGVSSIAACANKGKLPIALGNEGIAIIPADRLDLISQANGKFDTIIVLKANVNLRDITALLESQYKLIYARRCYLEGEKIIPWDPSISDKDYFSMIIGVKKRENG